MKELFRERDIVKVSFYQTLIEDAGIPTFMRNENISAAEGVIMPDFFPALCVVNDEDYDNAMRIIREDLTETAERSTEEVTCGQCRESSPGNFGNCWNCGATLDS